MPLPTQTLTRRAMLSSCAQATAVAALASNLEPLLAAPRPRSRWFKIGACDWSIGKMCSLEAFQVAREIGLDGVQVSLGTVQNDMQLRKPEVQKAYLEAAKKSGVAMASLAIGEMNNVPLKSDPRAAAWLLDSIDVCKALGLKIVMPACFAKGDLDMKNTKEIDQLVKALKDAAAKAEKAGVLIGLENYLSAEDNLKIVERVGSPAMRVYYDVGNSTDKGRDIYKEIRLLGNLICQWHAKDGRNLLGQGRIDFKKVRQVMDDIGYSGWVVLEAAAPNGLVKDYTSQCKFLKDIFPAQG